jgi:hypothetical protein
MAINPKKLIDKLILGLEQQGLFYVYTSKRFYSSKTQRYCTKYIIQKVDDKDSKIEVYNKLEIMKYLAREYKRVKGEPIPEELAKSIDEG